MKRNTGREIKTQMHAACMHRLMDRPVDGVLLRPVDDVLLTKESFLDDKEASSAASESGLVWSCGCFSFVSAP